LRRHLGGLAADPPEGAQLPQRLLPLLQVVRREAQQLADGGGLGCEVFGAFELLVGCRIALVGEGGDASGEVGQCRVPSRLGRGADDLFAHPARELTAYGGYGAVAMALQRAAAWRPSSDTGIAAPLLRSYGVHRYPGEYI